MITFTSKRTHTWVYTACIVLTAVGLLCSPELAFAQSATTTPPHVPLSRRQSGSLKDANPEVVPSLIVVRNPRCPPAGSDIDVGRSGTELHRLR